MRDGLCDCTGAVVAAALEGTGAGSTGAAGTLPPELQSHVHSCAACSDALLVGAVLARDAAELHAAAGPPAAEAVWRRTRARLDARALERATRPIAVVRRLAWGAGAVAWIGAMWRLTPAAKDWLRELRRLEWPGAESWWEMPAGAGFTGDGMVLAGAAAILFAVFYGVWAAWAEEG